GRRSLRRPRFSSRSGYRWRWVSFSGFIRRGRRRGSIRLRRCVMSSGGRRLAALLMVALMLPYAAMPSTLPGAVWWEHRMYPNVVQVRDVKGVQDRIVNSKLSLTLKSFLELVLMNSTDINVVRRQNIRAG